MYERHNQPLIPRNAFLKRRGGHQLVVAGIVLAPVAHRIMNRMHLEK